LRKLRQFGQPLHLARSESDDLDSGTGSENHSSQSMPALFVPEQFSPAVSKFGEQWIPHQHCLLNV